MHMKLVSEAISICLSIYISFIQGLLKGWLIEVADYRQCFQLEN